MRPRPLLDPKVLARIRDLRLLANIAVDGFLHGAHASRRHGAGVEFSHLQPYAPGDDPRTIDWKLYARSDRLYVRQAETESQLCVWFVVDTSASMGQASGEIDDWTRLDCARALTACLAWLASVRGDAVGLLALSDAGLDTVPARTGRRHLDRLLHSLSGLAARGRWPGVESVAPFWPRLERPSLVVLVSDFLQSAHEIEALCTRLRAAGKELLTVQLLTREEVAFPWRGAVEFVDPESGRVVPLRAHAARTQYRARLRGELTRLDRVLAGLGAFSQRALIEEDLGDIVHAFLERRGRGTQRGALGNG